MSIRNPAFRASVILVAVIAAVTVVLVAVGVRRPPTAPPYPPGWSVVPGTRGYVTDGRNGSCPPGWRPYRVWCLSPSAIVVSAQYR